jgi:hypothetical protein
VGGTIAVTEPDGVPFWSSGNAGSLSITLDTYVTGDTLSVLHQGTGAGQIGVSVSTVTTVSYGGTAFATIDTTDNGAGRELKLNFTSSTATTAAVQALLAQLRYSNTTNDDPTVGNNTDPSRVFTVTLNDGGNRKDTNSTTIALTATLTGTITITPTVDNPVVTATGTAVAYTENGTAVTVDSGLTITDADDTQLAGATVQITATDLRAGDVLAVGLSTGTGGNAGKFILSDTNQTNISASYASGSFTGTRSASSAMVAVPVFFKVGKVSVRRAKGICDVCVVLTFLIFIGNQDTNRGAGGFSFKYSREQFDFVFFFALGGNFGLAGLAALHF